MASETAEASVAETQLDRMVRLLQNLSPSPQVIKHAARVIMSLTHDAADVVDIWLEELRSVRPDMRLPFLYVANEVLAKMRGSDSPFEGEFIPVLEDAVRLVCEMEANRSRVLHVLDHWRNLRIFPKDFLDRLRMTAGAEAFDDTRKDVELEVHVGNLENPGVIETPETPGSQLLAILGTLKEGERNELTVQELRKRLEATSSTQLLEQYSSAKDILETAKISSEELKELLDSISLYAKALKSVLEKRHQLHDKLDELLQDALVDEQNHMEKSTKAFQDNRRMLDTISALKKVSESNAEEWRRACNESRLRKEEKQAESLRQRELAKLNEQKAIASITVPKLPSFAEDKGTSQASQSEGVTPVDAPKKRRMVWHPTLKEYVELPADDSEMDKWREH